MSSDEEWQDRHKAGNIIGQRHDVWSTGVKARMNYVFQKGSIECALEPLALFHSCLICMDSRAGVCGYLDIGRYRIRSILLHDLEQPSLCTLLAREI